MSTVAFVVGALTATIIVGLTAALVLERARRLDLAGRVAQLEKLLSNLERVAKNKLYRVALENKQTQVLQAALRLRVAQQDIDDAMRILNLDPKE